MEGILIVNKPSGWTSFDVVAKIRNLSRVKKVGHSGTLDPMATGVLPVFLGKATKSIKYFLEGDKGYQGEMVLGVRTDTLDAEGKILDQPSPPIPLSQWERGGTQCRGEGLKQAIEELFKKYTGEIEQVPPMYSAKKIKGKRLYELAREGKVIEREPKKVTIHKLELQKVDLPKVTFEVYCSKGMYVRQLVSDIGDDLGVGAHLSKLRRIYAQPFHISQAINMDTIITLAKVGKLDTILLKVEDFLHYDRK